MAAVTIIAQLLLSLSILVIFHELGHFTFAKIFKTRVEKFYLFFDPWFSLFKFKKGDTEYGIGWLPLGGYVKISGMIDESMDKEAMKEEPKPWEFRSKKTWQRLLIMIGGVLVNFILAGLIFVVMLFTWGDDYLPNENVIYGISTDSLGYKLGLQNGDKIISVNNEKIARFSDIRKQMILNSTRTMQIERNGSTIEVELQDSDIALILEKKGLKLDPRFPFVIQEIPDESPAKISGFEKGDKFVSANGKSLMFYDEYVQFFLENKNKEVTIGVQRSSGNKEITAKVDDKGKIGVQVSTTDLFELEHVEYGIVEAIPAGFKRGFEETGSYLSQLKLVFTPETGAYKEVGGFYSISKLFPPVWDWQWFWKITAILSIMLGVVNILPIPALDGGHVMFLIFEMISGRPPSEKFMEYAQMTGMVLLVALLLYANGNDILKIFQ